ncbi:MAG: GNAT family N-acetyltransferase [Promethearchaeota archaeon]
MHKIEKKTDEKLNILIRDANYGDLPEITELWKELMDFHYKRDKYFKRGKMGHLAFVKHVEKRIDNPDWNKIVIAIYEKKIIGYCLARLMEYLPVFDEKLYGEIIDLSVSEKYRGQGIGIRLVNEVLNWFKSKKIKRIHVTLSVKNEISTKFWSRVGFKPFKEIRYFEFDDL